MGLHFLLLSSEAELAVAFKKKILRVLLLDILSTCFRAQKMVTNKGNRCNELKELTGWEKDRDEVTPLAMPGQNCLVP